MNLENVKNRNQSEVLRLLNNNGPMSRKDIAGAVGLTAASVTLMCTELLEKNIIVELGEVPGEKRAGRKKILVDINNDYKKALCIAIETDKTYITITDMKGGIKAKTILKTEKKETPEDFLKDVSDAAGRLLWDNDISRDMLLGAGVTVPGKVDAKKGTSLGAYNIWDRPLEIGDIISEDLGVEVTVENNLKAAAQLEILFGLGRQNKNLFLLKWGPGVGSAIILDRKVYDGSNNAAGEIGHTTLGKDGRLCKCGRRGCLETYISTHAILDDVALMLGDSTMYKKDLSLLGDEKVRGLMDEKMDRLAQTLRNAVSLIDSDRVVVLGYIFEVDGMLDRFKNIYRTYDSTSPEDFIVASELGSKSAHIEPLALLMNNFLSYR